MVSEVQHLNLAPVHRLLDLSAGPASLKLLVTAGGISLWHCLCINTAMILFSYTGTQSPTKPHCIINNRRGTKGFSRDRLFSMKTIRRV